MQISVRRLKGSPLGEAQRGLLESFVKHTVGKHLEMASLTVVQAVLRKWTLGACCAAPREDWSDFFCSELVAEALQQASVIRETGCSSSDFLPNSFAGGLHRRVGILENYMCDGYSYAPLEQLLSPHGHLRQHLRARREALRRSKEIPISFEERAGDGDGDGAKHRPEPEPASRLDVAR
jgi:hypothetical protein